MSPPPWTLFWPRSGFTPLPYTPTCPVSRLRLINASTLSTALWCSVMPERPADRRAIGLGVGVRDLPDRPRPARPSRLAPRSSVQSITDALYASNPVVAPCDERVVLQVVGDDLARDRVRERDVACPRRSRATDRPTPRTPCGADPPRSASRRCGSPSGRGGRRSDAPRARSIPTRGRDRCARSLRMSLSRRLLRTLWPDRPRRERVRCGCSCRCCCSAGPDERTSVRRSSSRSWPSSN